MAELTVLFSRAVVRRRAFGFHYTESQSGCPDGSHNGPLTAVRGARTAKPPRAKIGRESRTKLGGIRGLFLFCYTPHMSPQKIGSCCVVGSKGPVIAHYAEKSVAEGFGLIAVAQEIGVSKSALHRHCTEHVAKREAKKKLKHEIISWSNKRLLILDPTTDCIVSCVEYDSSGELCIEQDLFHKRKYRTPIPRDSFKFLDRDVLLSVCYADPISPKLPGTS